MNDHVKTISVEDLKVTWRTLLTAASNYEPLQVDLIEARRLIEVEIRTQYGDEVWREITQ